MVRAAGDFQTYFLTEALYTWGDPRLNTHWETGIAGYKVFERDDLFRRGTCFYSCYHLVAAAILVTRARAAFRFLRRLLVRGGQRGAGGPSARR